MGHSLFREGDKVIQTRNNYDKDVFNGDMGVIDSVDSMNGKVEILFDDRRVMYERMEVTDLQPAYAISIHKSQGSEYPVVVFPILKQHFMMLQRNLVYTGLTRAKNKVVFVGDPAAYAMAIKNHKTLVRKTDLIRKLRCRRDGKILTPVPQGFRSPGAANKDEKNASRQHEIGRESLDQRIPLHLQVHPNRGQHKKRQDKSRRLDQRIEIQTGQQEKGKQYLAETNCPKRPFRQTINRKFLF